MAEVLKSSKGNQDGVIKSSNGKAWKITKGTPVSYFCMGRDPTLQWHRRKEEKQETKVHSLFFKSQTSYITKNLQSGRGRGRSKSRPKCKLTSNCFYLLRQISCACPYLSFKIKPSFLDTSDKIYIVKLCPAEFLVSGVYYKTNIRWSCPRWRRHWSR